MEGLFIVVESWKVEKSKVESGCKEEITNSKRQSSNKTQKTKAK